MVKGEGFVVGDGGSNPSMALFFLNFFFYFLFEFFSSFCINLNFLIRKSSQTLLNQTDVAVVEELEKVIINIYSSTETDIGTTSRATSTLPEKLRQPPVKQRCVYSLDFECILFRMLKFS